MKRSTGILALILIAAAGAFNCDASTESIVLKRTEIKFVLASNAMGENMDPATLSALDKAGLEVGPIFEVTKQDRVAVRQQVNAGLAANKSCLYIREEMRTSIVQAMKTPAEGNTLASAMHAAFRQYPDIMTNYADALSGYAGALCMNIKATR